MSAGLRSCAQRALGVFVWVGAAVMLSGTCAATMFMCPGPGYGKAERARLDLANLEQAAKIFEKRFGRAPERTAELVQKQILEKQPLDPWGDPYGYALICGWPVFYSLGADKFWGGQDDAADLSSRGTIVGQEEFGGPDLDLANLRCATARIVASEHRLPYGISELVDEAGLTRPPTDEWGRPYRYWIVRGQAVFVSLGSDGKCGGGGEDADIASGNFVVHRGECEARDR